MKIKAKDEYGLVMAAAKLTKKLKEHHSLALPAPEKPLTVEGVHPATPLLMLTGSSATSANDNMGRTTKYATR